MDDHQPIVTPEPPVTDLSKSHTPKALIISAIVVAVAGIGVAALLMKKDTTKDQSSNEVAKTESTATPTATASAIPSPSPSPSPAGLTFSVAEAATQILPGGYADPTVVPTKTGYRLYINTFGNGPSGYLTFTSTDAKTWKKEKDIILPGVATGRAIVLPDGIRFYYPGPQPIKASDAPADMFSSFSSNGTSFKKDAGSLISPRSSAYYLEGPTVFQLPDKTWRMYFNENTIAAGNNRDGEIWGASSTDGKTWKRDTTVTLQADGTTEAGTETWKQVLHPFVLTNPKGGYIMLYNSHSELYAATSTDGIAWKKTGKIGVHGADADGFFQADGKLRLYYGGFSEKEGGLVYTTLLNME